MIDSLEVNKKLCPLCGMPNACQDGPNCWCHNVVIPKDLLERVPEEQKGKFCICYFCIEEYNKKRKK